MASSTADASEAGMATPVLVDGVVDYKGRPIIRYKSGGWRSASFIIFVEVTERFAYYGISSNLISYLTGPLGQSTATAAENVNAWSGAVSLLPLLGAFVADSFVGRFRTIVIACVIYILGLGLLILSAVLPSLSSSDCKNASNVRSCSPSQLEIVFFLSLYLVAVAQGGYRPNIQAFGAGQFDAQDPQECKAKSSFFNWWCFGGCIGSLTAVLILNYIQDNLSWGLGFGIPWIAMTFALIVFLLGTTTYRFGVKSDEKRPFTTIGRVFIEAARNWRSTPSEIAMEEEAHRILPHQGGTDQFKFLNEALLEPDSLKEDRKVCSANEVEATKAVLGLLPIWTACLLYAVVFAQSSTLFTKQGATMDRSIGSSFDIPAASLQSFMNLTLLILVPIYDRIFVPIARAITRKPSGITVLQRIGTGLIISIISMIVAAMVEGKRLETALEYGLVDKPDAIVPLSFWWLVPQYILIGVVNVFTVVGLQEFFYDQMPSELKSVGLSLNFTIFGVGSFLSSFLISIVEKITRGGGQDGWFSDNLNRAHLDYFYWLLAGLSAVASAAYLYSAKSYVYNRGSV